MSLNKNRMEEYIDIINNYYMNEYTETDIIYNIIDNIIMIFTFVFMKVI